MNKQLFSTISKEYEKLYKELKLKGLSSVETIKILNDSILIPFILPKETLAKYISSKDYQLYDIVNKKILFSNKSLWKKAGMSFWGAIYFFCCVVYGTEETKAVIEDILGSVLEKHINRKETGSYYTPEDTTKYISWNAILISILNKADRKIKSKVFNTFNIHAVVDLLKVHKSVEEKIDTLKLVIEDDEIAKIVSIIKKLKIIDPTCGSGAFIVSAFEFLEYLNTNFLFNKLKEKDIFNCIFGVDISEEAVLLTKMRCIMHFHKTVKFESWFNDSFDRHFVVADALTGPDYVLANGEGFDWKTFDKFDCIIGNPPYVEHKSLTSDRFVSKKCGNLYAYIIERSCNIVSNEGMIAFIVPLPLIATPRMKTIREYLHSHSSKVYYSSYADRPGCLFTGVHQRLTIFFAQIGDSNNLELYTSKYHYWYNGERKTLFKNIDYYLNSSELLPKVGNEMEYRIFTKINACEKSLYSYFEKNANNCIWISTRIGFWTKAFLDKISTNEVKQYFISDKIEKKIIYCLLNSSIFYFYWILTSDCWHVTNNDLIRFKFDITRLNETYRTKLCELADELSRDLEKNKVKIDTKQTLYEYKHKFSKNIIDDIDDILGCVYNLTQEEIDYVKNYTIKYRLNTYHKEG